MPHISFLTFGTRGDVEPFMALAHYFHDLGYHIRFAAPIDFQSWVEQQGFDFAPTTLTPIREIVENPILQDLMHFNVFKIRKAMASLQNFTRQTIVESIPHIIDKTDLIIAHCGLPIACDVAEHTKAPLIYISPIPAVATKTIPTVPLTKSLGFLNKATYLPMKYGRCFTPALYREAREIMGLPPVSRFQKSFYLNGDHVPILHCFSQHILPRPYDWPDHAYITGPLFLDKEAVNWKPEPDLARFLAAGPPPVYIGFGSMITGQAENLLESMLATAKQTGQRILLSKGWAELNLSDHPDDEFLSNNVFMLGNVPHHALFPLVKAVVHHGGAGTLAAGLRAGRPTLICPFGFDQPWWGAQVARQKLGPAPLPQKKLTQQTFTTAFKDLINNPIYAQNANQLANAMAQEDGVKNAAQTIFKLFGLQS